MQRRATPGTILVVDDDEGLLFLIEAALRREKWVVRTVTSGKQALEWLRNNTADLMLLDLKLNDIDGKDLVHSLSSARCAVPFIVITGHGDERVAVEMMKHGAVDYLVKDVGMVELLPSVVKQAIAHLEQTRVLRATEAALNESRRQVLAITDQERTRLGAELHDGLGQQLTAVELLCYGLKTDLSVNYPGLANEVEKICGMVREAVAQARSIARGLAPVNLGESGLMDAIKSLADRAGGLGKIECEFDCPSPVLLDDAAAGHHLFRIAQEAVNNSVRHSQGNKIMIRLRDRSGMLCLEISDNGKGFGSSKNGEGIGLQLMRHRATVIGAELEVTAVPGRGVKVVCTFKKPKPIAPAATMMCGL